MCYVRGLQLHLPGAKSIENMNGGGPAEKHNLNYKQSYFQLTKNRDTWEQPLLG